MRSLLNIYSSLQYATIAPLLGLEPTAKHAINAKCPNCGANAWSVHQDTRNLEEWHYCYQCKISGSIIELAASRLDLSLNETIDFLVDRLDLNLTPYEKKQILSGFDTRKAFMELWEKAQANLLTLTPEDRSLIASLRWNPTDKTSFERFTTNVRPLYGIARAEEVQQYLGEEFYPKIRSLVVVPYFRTMRDIGAFTLLCRDREYILTDKRINNNRPNNGYRREIGFAGFPLIQEACSDAVVATSMLSTMMMLHMHNFKCTNIPLSLISYRATPGIKVDKNWSIFGGRKFIFWEQKPTASLINQAVLTDARISFAGPENSEKVTTATDLKNCWWTWVHKFSAKEQFKRIISTSKPFEQALEQWSRGATSNAKSELYREAEQYSRSVFELVQGTVFPKKRSQFGSRVNVPTRGSAGLSNAVGHTVVVEREGKWYTLDGHVRLSGILRVTQIVYRDREKFYVGYLQSQGNKYSFQVESKKATWSWLKEFAFAHGVFLHSDSFINSHRNRKTENYCPFDAACRFEAPQVVSGLSVIGWDGEGFQFKKAKLVKGQFRQIPDFSFMDEDPGPNQSFSVLSESLCNSLQKSSNEMEAIWALNIALAAQVTSLCVNLPTYGIVVDRKELDAALCSLYFKTGITKGDYINWPHKWPRRLDSLSQALKQDGTGFFVSRRYRQRVESLENIILVDLEDLQLQPRLISQSADKIIPNYLRHFTQLDWPKTDQWSDWLNFTTNQFKLAFPYADSSRLAAAIRRVRIA